MTKETSERNDLHFVASVDDLDVGERVLTTINGVEIGLFRTENGFYAVTNFCPHQGGPLCEGLCSGTVTTDEDFELQYTGENDVIFCPWHGWEFDIETGDHLSQTGLKVPTFNTVTDDRNVYIKI